MLRLKMFGYVNKLSNFYISMIENAIEMSLLYQYYYDASYFCKNRIFMIYLLFNTFLIIVLYYSYILMYNT